METLYGILDAVLPLDAFRFTFMKNAFLAILLLTPMLGLLGTVWGMMVSFSGLESGVSMINKADTLANGVSQAMYTTFGGLIVGIFAMAMYDLMRGRLNKLIGGMESACNSVLRRLSASNRL